jgi:mannose/fructose/N-acetylgalactosamine-specific phosphotransferase system component IIC
VLQIIRRVPPDSAAVVVTVAVAVAVAVLVAVCVTVDAGPPHADSSNITTETSATITIDQCLTFMHLLLFYFIFDHWCILMKITGCWLRERDKIT